MPRGSITRSRVRHVNTDVEIKKKKHRALGGGVQWHNAFD
jgi:hypothetical protein